MFLQNLLVTVIQIIAAPLPLRRRPCFGQVLGQALFSVKLRGRGREANTGGIAFHLRGAIAC